MERDVDAALPFCGTLLQSIALLQSLRFRILLRTELDAPVSFEVHSLLLHRKRFIISVATVINVSLAIVVVLVIFLIVLSGASGTLCFKLHPV